MLGSKQFEGARTRYGYSCVPLDGPPLGRVQVIPREERILAGTPHHGPDCLNIKQRALLL